MSNYNNYYVRMRESIGYDSQPLFTIRNPTDKPIKLDAKFYVSCDSADHTDSAFDVLIVENYKISSFGGFGHYFEKLKKSKLEVDTPTTGIWDGSGTVLSESKVTYADKVKEVILDITMEPFHYISLVVASPSGTETFASYLQYN